MVIDRFNGDDESYILYYWRYINVYLIAIFVKHYIYRLQPFVKSLLKWRKRVFIRTHGGAASIDDRDETMKRNPESIF